MEKLKQALAELGYSKSDIALIIETAKCIEHSPDVYVGVNELVKELQAKALELGKVNETLKQIGAVVGMVPKATKEKNPGGIPRVKKTEKAAPKKPTDEAPESGYAGADENQHKGGKVVDLKPDAPDTPGEEPAPLRKEEKKKINSPKIEL